jgi:hypothetical protein
MKIWRAATAATTGLAASALLAGVPAGASFPTFPLTVNPATSTDAVFDVSGTGCVKDGAPGVIDVFIDGAPLTNDDPNNPDLADADGSWTFTIEPAPGSGLGEPGVLQITASCTINDGSGTEILRYAPASHEVVAAPSPTPTPTPEPTPAPETPSPAPAAPAAPVTAQPKTTG